MRDPLTSILTSRWAMRVKRPLKDAYWRFRGLTISNPKPPFMPRSLLFVCKGNICRSPFAERLARRLLDDGGRTEVECRSAGLRIKQANSPPAEAVAAAAAHGVDLSGHRPCELTAGMVAESDMVFVMETRQLEHIRRKFEEHEHKLFLLPLFEEGTQQGYGGFLRLNLSDPFGKGAEGFRESYTRIERCLRGLFLATGLPWNSTRR